MKRYLFTVLRIAVPAAILLWLLWDVQREDPQVLQRLVARKKDLWLLSASLACLLAATCCSFVRWFLLVRALEIPFTLRETFRLSFLGYLLNFVGPGAVGGDVFKAYFVVRDQRSRRAEAVATIFLDRVVGFYSLLVVASLAISLRDYSGLTELATFLRAVQLLTFVGGVGILVLLLPASYSQRLIDPLMQLPVIGPIVKRTAAALELYRRRRTHLVLIASLSVAVHALIGISIHLTDVAIFPQTPTLGEHLVISPLAAAAGGLPVPGGIGTYEAAMHYLFRQLPSETVEQGQGLTVALCYRLMTIAVAAVGAIYYVLNRRTVTEAVSSIEAEQSQ